MNEKLGHDSLDGKQVAIAIWPGKMHKAKKAKKKESEKKVEKVKKMEVKNMQMMKKKHAEET